MRSTCSSTPRPAGRTSGKLLYAGGYQLVIPWPENAASVEVNLCGMSWTHGQRSKERQRRHGDVQRPVRLIAWARWMSQVQSRVNQPKSRKRGMVTRYSVPVTGFSLLRDRSQ